MAKKDRRERAGNDNKENGSATTRAQALRESALRAVRRALAQAEESVRSIDAALRSRLKSQKRNTSAKRQRKVRRG